MDALGAGLRPARPLPMPAQPGVARRLGSVLRGLAGAVLVAVAAAGAWAQDVLPVPALAERVTDQSTTLDAAQRSALAAKLAALEQQTGAQVAVLIVPTTQPEDITDYAQRVGDAWKLGRKVEGDGALIVVATNDRRVRVVVTKALEGAVPDLAARQIITRHISPAFRAGDYAGGLNAAVDALAARIRGEALPAPQQPSSRAESLGLEGLAVFMFVAVPIVAVVLGGLLGRKLGVLGTAGGTGALAWFFSGSVGLAALAGGLGLVVALLVGMAGALRGYGPSGSSRLGGRGAGRHHAAPIIWGSGGGWGGGGGGWGGGGGGFSSGGGGDFGGGGASGDW
jgi:uncharacterized protein